MQQQLKYVDYIWNEVNVEEQYIGLLKDLLIFLKRMGFQELVYFGVTLVGGCFLYKKS